jgi:hypothetical protein
MELSKFKHGGKLVLICHLVWLGLVRRRLVSGDGEKIGMGRTRFKNYFAFRNTFPYSPYSKRELFSRKTKNGKARISSIAEKCFFLDTFSQNRTIQA